MHERSTFRHLNLLQILHGFLTRPCGPAELASQKSGADCSGNSSLLKDTHTSKALNLLALCFSPPQGHMLAEACTRKLLHSYTALVQRMPMSTLPDLSTALNKHYLQAYFYTFKSGVALLWFYSFLSEIMIEYIHFFCKIFLLSYSLIQDV